MDTPPPSQPSSSDPPPAPVHQTQYALPASYQFNEINTPNGPGTFTNLDEVADAEVAKINHPTNIAEARIQEQMARARIAAIKALEQQSPASSVATEGRTSSAATSTYGT